jgi:hypothetical protein
LGADEAALEIRVDDTSGLRRARAGAHCPGARLFRTDGEEGQQPEQRVTGADEAVEARLLQPNRLQKLALFVFRHWAISASDRGRDDDTRPRLFWRPLFGPRCPYAHY